MTLPADHWHYRYYNGMAESVEFYRYSGSSIIKQTSGYWSK